MAEQTDAEVCSICLNDFQQPVVLDCQHSFCFICLEDYMNKTSINDQFLCPLCRCFINVGDRGVQRLRLKQNIDNNSTVNIPRCDVCTEDKSQYFCQDCDQYLCKSCKTIHSKLKSSKDHLVCRYDEKQVSQQKISNENVKEKTIASCVTLPIDICQIHVGGVLNIYCKDCLLAVCFNCFVTNHNGHTFLDLQKDEVREDIRQDLKTLNNDLKKQITHCQKHYDNLNSKLTEVKNFTKTECDKIDVQVDKICAEFRKIGEHIKKEMQKSTEKEESKFGKLMENIKRLIEDLKASIKYSVNVLEDSSIVQVLQRLPKVRQEKDESCCSKFDIPVVRYPIFQVADTDKTLLINQLGKVVSCHQTVFEDDFNVDSVRDWYDGKLRVFPGFTWSINVYKHSSSLRVLLYLKDVEDKSMTSCNVDVTYKVINKTDHRQSIVVKQYNVTFKPCGWSYSDTDIIDWKILSNPNSGFIGEHRYFTMQVTISKITDTKKRYVDYGYAD